MGKSVKCVCLETTTPQTPYSRFVRNKQLRHACQLAFVMYTNLCIQESQMRWLNSKTKMLIRWHRAVRKEMTLINLARPGTKRVPTNNRWRPWVGGRFGAILDLCGAYAKLTLGQENELFSAWNWCLKESTVFESHLDQIWGSCGMNVI